jgi:hypothetical protein
MRQTVHFVYAASPFVVAVPGEGLVDGESVDCGVFREASGVFENVETEVVHKVGEEGIDPSAVGDDKDVLLFGFDFLGVDDEGGGSGCC